MLRQPVTAGAVAAPEAILVERTEENGAIHEVFEVAGELVVVESWSSEEVTVPDAPRARRRP